MNSVSKEAGDWDWPGEGGMGSGWAMNPLARKSKVGRNRIEEWEPLNESDKRQGDYTDTKALFTTASSKQIANSKPH
jgi:hypothetical protein